MSTKQVTSIDFVIEDNVYYSNKALLEFRGKAGKATVVVRARQSHLPRL